MVIGNGLIATAFKEFENSTFEVIFASGVSNSLETDLNEFKREEELLLKTLNDNPEKMLVYFSSFVDADPKKKMYAEHKERMIEIIQSSKVFYMIIVLPQVIGNGGNKNTLINFIVNKLQNDETINVYKSTYKALIDVDDVVRLYKHLIAWRTLNMYFQFPFIEKLYVEEIVNLIAKQLNIEPKINLIEYQHNIEDMQLSIAAECAIRNLNIETQGYTQKVIKKYI